MASEALDAIREFVAARREHFRWTPEEKDLDLPEFNRTALRYETALEELERIADKEGSA